ncbi:hypothetical protein DVH24_034660 [Malus domestica]|uniref:Uncharacterized protein n=1 Tax=Malus domestica TaxID=3750 RepID=A0A498IX31_MALDO|nr:hypothetical protein DVH24_034660 [Malus domestica]
MGYGDGRKPWQLQNQKREAIQQWTNSKALREAIALCFQHYFLALGTAVMIPTFRVPLMGGDDGDKVRVVQTLRFIQGISTLLQTLFRTRLPTVIGGSYTFVVRIISIIYDLRLMKIEDNHAVSSIFISLMHLIWLCAT